MVSLGFHYVGRRWHTTIDQIFHGLCFNCMTGYNPIFADYKISHKLEFTYDNFELVYVHLDNIPQL